MRAIEPTRNLKDTTAQSHQSQGQIPHFKDKYHISDEAWYELHMLGVALPSLSPLKQERERLSSAAVTIENPFQVSKLAMRYYITIQLLNIHWHAVLENMVSIVTQGWCS